MKRVAQEDIGRDSKRPKRDSSGVDSTAIFRNPAHEKTATDLLQWTPGHSGYVCGKICMKWPVIKGKYRVKMEIFSVADGLKQFEAAFSGICGEEFRRKGLEFKMGQELKLSLKGAVTEKASPQGISLPVSLKYTEGVALVIVSKGPEPEITIDTWYQPVVVNEPSEPASTVDSWFSTPRQPMPPVRAAAPPALMDIDEEPAAVAVSPPSAHKPVSKSSIAPEPANHRPLTNLRNSLPIASSPRLMSMHKTSSSSPSPSCFARPPPAIVQPLTNFRNSLPIVPSPRPMNTSSSSPSPSCFARPLPAIVQPPKSSVLLTKTTVNANHASPAELPEHISAPAVEAVELPDARRARPAEAESASESATTLNKKQRKNLARREKKRKQQKTGNPPPAVPAVLAITTAVVDPPNTDSAVHTEMTTPARTVPSVAAHSQSSPFVPEPTTPNPSLTSLPTVPHNFTPIAQLEAPGGRWNVYSIIGVVTSSTAPSTTKKGDWGCSLRIVDPSICDESCRAAKEGLLVNCFRKKYKEWLPTVSAGDVILLQDIKTSRNGDVVASGFSDKFKWAVYDRTKGQINHGSLGSAPESEALAESYGRVFTPLYHATDAELTYCMALDEWWRAVEAKRLAALGTVHQIEAGTPFASSRPGRKHQLISETNIGEYFDCTVRVLHGHPNGQTYRIYVTDGTPLQGSQPCRLNEIPLPLVDLVMPIEMWDGACLEGPSLVPNEYYLLRNVRLKQSREGYAEGKLVEAKIQKLEHDGVDEYPNLKALKERLQPYDDKDVVEEMGLDLKLIKDAQDREYVSCVVELLHIDEYQHAIYVTDYTAHPKLPTIKEPWALGLDGHILKIVLFDEQRAKLQHLSIGQYYTILQLRLQASSTAQEFRGTVGGSEKFILPVNPKSSAVGVWRENLLQRKNNLKYQTESRTEIMPVLAPQRLEVSPPRNHRNCLSIKQVLEIPECPRTFLVRARVIDFFPFKLSDSFKRTCTKCNTMISSHRLACFGCNDLEKKYVKIVSILHVLIDDGDQNLRLSVSGNIPLLDDIEPTILLDDPEAARNFACRLKPLLNNLEEVHDGMLKKEIIKPECSEMTLIIDSWSGADKKIMYGLRGYEP
ncbi:hypothetical protein B0H12DRAFT_511554 [Mycena haematopus]|nr:hypothetical protein B0H12DRAFT_511554 [Mycena haematopus]